MNNFNKNLPYKEPVPAAKSEMGTYIVIVIIAFALGLGSGWLWLKKNVALNGEVKDKKTAENASEEINKMPIENLLADNSILVNAQPAGVEVVVEKVILAKMAWVVVREDDGAGQPGKILGAQLFDAGVGVGRVELLRGTEAGKTYYALIYSDNGDRAFDPKLDSPLTDASGQSVMATFKVN